MGRRDTAVGGGGGPYGELRCGGRLKSGSHGLKAPSVVRIACDHSDMYRVGERSRAERKVGKRTRYLARFVACTVCRLSRGE